MDDAAQMDDVGMLAEFRQMLSDSGASTQVLHAFDGPGSPDQVVQEMMQSGLLPSHQDALAGIVSQFEPLLEPGTDPLQAELSGVEMLSLLRQGAADPDQVPDMLGAMVAQAEEYGGPAAVAMLRVLAATAPTATVRAAATAAAGRLLAAGLPEPPWATGLGTPKVGSSFGHADPHGAQEAIAVTFSYGRKRHAMAVLIDHDLGGGVKDCWPTDRPDRIRAGYKKTAAWHDLWYREYTPAEAYAILDRALRKPPCPTQPDQVEDVHDYLDLLRQRVALLAPAAPAPSPGAGPAVTAPTVHRLKVTIRGTKPPIWRRLDVPSQITVAGLHQVLQEAFGWEDYHLWVVETGQRRYGLPDPDLGHRDAAQATLADVAPGAGVRLRYTYDFGDNWEHDIVVEGVAAAEPGVAYPRCLAGRRAAPPEDCGGVWGYGELLEVLDRPDHPEHRDRVEWLGLDSADQFDPAGFDCDEINQALDGEVLVAR